MAAELIRDQQGGAITVDFTELSTAELKSIILLFPEALQEYTKRLVGSTAR